MRVVSRYTGLDPWRVRSEDCPRDGSRRAQLEFAVHWAILAPSSHNSQPWLFDIHDDSIDVIADRTRALPVVDPDDRELIISCGAAVAYLELALANFEFQTRVRWWPNDDPDLVASVDVLGHAPPATDLRRLFKLIADRCTNRAPFESRPVPDAVLEHAVLDASGCGIKVVPLDTPDKQRVATVIAEADVVQMGNEAFRRELAAWIHPNRTGRRDGMRGYSRGSGEIASIVSPAVLRTFDVGKGVAARDRALAEGSPALLVFESPDDSPADWSATGAALALVLLRLTQFGLAASFLNQPIEVAHLRSRISHIANLDGVAQLIVRAGWPTASAPHTPRLPLDSVLVANEVRP